MSGPRPLPAEQVDQSAPRLVRIAPDIEVIVPPEVRSVWLDPDGRTLHFEAHLTEARPMDRE